MLIGVVVIVVIVLGVGLNFIQVSQDKSSISILYYHSR